MIKRPLVTLLYEDARGQISGFGLHRLIVASVWDKVGGGAERFLLEKALEPRCMKGVERIIAVCRDDLENIARDGRQVAAIVDEDVIREKLNAPASASVPEVADRLRARCPASVREQLAVFIIQRNTETVLRATRDCINEQGLDLLEAGLVDRALRKELLARDQVLNRAAQQTHSLVRQCILTKVPSLSALITWLSESYRQSSKPGGQLQPS